MQQRNLTSIKKWLNKPFPFYESYRQKILIPLLPTLFVMTGILILSWTNNYNILWKQINSVLTYGSIVLFITLTLSLVLPAIFPKIFDAEKWNVLKTLAFILLTIITIGLVITLIAYNLNNPKDLNFLSFFVAILIRSITLSFFPIIIIVFYFEGVLHKKNNLMAVKIIDEINKEKYSKKQADRITLTFARNTKDEIQIAENDLIYIKAEGNYCKFFYETNSAVLQKLIRINMREVESCLKKSNNFLRCHKSYIVNLPKISNVTGNARGYLFHIEHSENKIPGSRNLSKSVINDIKSFIRK